MDTNYGLAWAAGFFDGEGTAGLIRHNAVSKRTGIRTFGHYAQIAVYGTHKPSLVRFATIVSDGRIYRIIPKKGNPYFAWRATSATAIRVLNLLYPFVYTKRLHVRLLLRAATITAGHKPGILMSDKDANRLVEIASTIRALNHYQPSPS